MNHYNLLKLCFLVFRSGLAMCFRTNFAVEQIEFYLLNERNRMNVYFCNKF